MTEVILVVVGLETLDREEKVEQMSFDRSGGVKIWFIQELMHLSQIAVLS